MSPIISGAVGGGGGALALVNQSTLAVDATTFDFTAISGAYNDLVLVLVGRSQNSVNSESPALTFNGDGAGNYFGTYLQQNNAAPTGSGSSAQTSIPAAPVPGTTATAGHYGTQTIEICGYASTVWVKQVRIYGGFTLGTGAANTVDQIEVYAWNSTAAITRVTLTLGATFKAGSTARLYGRT